MGRFQDFLKGARQPTTDPGATQPAPSDDHSAPTTESDRRGVDRRQRVDLTRPAHTERRQPGGSRRRQQDTELIEQQPVEVQAIISSAAQVAVEPSSTASVAELTAAVAKLQASIDEISSRAKGLSTADFEAAYARAAPVVTEMNAELKRLNELLRQAAQGEAHAAD